MKTVVTVFNKFNDIVDLFETKDNKNMNSKSIFLSKTFWINVIGLAQLITGLLPIDAEITGEIIVLLNIVNRKLTNSPVHIITDPNPVIIKID